MESSNSRALGQIQQLLQKPQSFIEREFSPYFHRYFTRYSNPKKFDGYLNLCKYLFQVTKSKDAAVLDLGCGFGLMATVFGLYGSREVVGYDLNDEKMECFKKMLLHLNPEIKNVKPVFGDSSKIQYPDEHFDVVVANETFSHIGEMRGSFTEVYRVLKIEGRFLLRDGNNSLFLLGRIRRRRFWRRIEQGPVDPSWFRSTDIPLPYFEVRKEMIHKKFPEMDLKKVNFLSRATSGMFGDEIYEAVDEFERCGAISERPKFCYRNPTTGEFPERELNPFTLKSMLEQTGFDVSFVPYFYSASFRDCELAVKRSYYLLEKYFPLVHVFLSPGFALLGVKKRLGRI